MKAFFDIDTQLDFLTPGGALYGPGAERLIPAIAALSRHAAAHKIPLISTTDAHPENAAEFQIWPPHCVAGTFGQQKPCATLLAKRTVVPYDPSWPGAAQIESTSQIVIEKNDSTCSATPTSPPCYLH